MHVYLSKMYICISELSAVLANCIGISTVAILLLLKFLMKGDQSPKRWNYL